MFYLLIFDEISRLTLYRYPKLREKSQRFICKEVTSYKIHILVILLHLYILFFLLGMKFQNVNILVNALEQNEYIRSMQYCWLDKHGAVCQQKGVFRVNCIDCLDRTNVVQTAIAKNVIETQLIKLGLIPPEHGIPVNLRLTIQVSSQQIFKL